MSKKALITGITGQMGSYLADLLLEKNYEVHGMVRRTSNPIDQNIRHIKDKIIFHHGDLTDGGSMHQIIQTLKPDEIYNLGAMSDVRRSFDMPVMTMDVNCSGLLRIIESVRQLNLTCKIYHSGTSEVFGRVQETPQKETTPYYPLSPYAVSKAASIYMARVYRESYGMKIYTGLFFNTESERRGEDFVTKKICKAVAEIVNGKREKIILGNLDAKRDWGYCPEYVQWIWTIVQNDTPSEYVIATGETHSVREFLDEAFSHVGIEDWSDYVECDESLLRPGEVDLLCGDATKSKELLGFEPKVKFKELVARMMSYELRVAAEPKYAFGYVK
jgi:GDPmannose 4,6-dehydratase